MRLAVGNAGFLPRFIAFLDGGHPKCMGSIRATSESEEEEKEPEFLLCEPVPCPDSVRHRPVAAHTNRVVVLVYGP